MTGTTIAQAIPIAISPILTRLYTPDDLGVLALYIALTSIISVIVTGRYELAVMLPKDDGDAVNIVALSTTLSFLISFSLFLVVFFFSQPIAQLLGAPEIAKWLYFVPVSTMLTGIYQSLNYWSNRKKDYRRMGISRVLQTGSVSAVQLAAGYTPLAAAGLISGQVVGVALSTAALAHIVMRDDRHELKQVSKARTAAVAKEYSNFPKYLVAAHGFNTGSFQSPVILLGSLFNPAVAGFYTLAQRVIGSPMSIVSGAIGDVFRQEASHAYTHTGNCKAIYLKALKRLLAVSTLPFLVFYFIAPDLFEFVFGAAWRVSGEYVQLLAPMFWLRFLTSPLSNMFIIAQKQRLDLLWQFTLFILVVSSFVTGWHLGSTKIALILFCASYSLMYLLNCYLSFRLACGDLASSIPSQDPEVVGKE